MAEELLSVREFERWAEQFDKRLQNVDALSQAVTQNTIDIEVIKQSCAKSKGINSAISATVAGVVSGLAVFFGGGK